MASVVMTALGHLRRLESRRQLPLEKGLGRKTQKRLWAKQKIRKNDRTSQPPYMFPGIQGEPERLRKIVRKSKPRKPKLFPKKSGASVWIVPDNIYPHAPENWPEKGDPIGTPEECLAFSGKAAAPGGCRYTLWRKIKAPGLASDFHCSHGNALTCMCISARQSRYERWVSDKKEEISWSYSSNRQFFEGGMSGSCIKPPDWPETYPGRLGVTEERHALEGRINSEGLNYREWYNENFYRAFKHHGGSCVCKTCARARYKEWSIT